MFPHKLNSVFRFVSEDNRLLIDSISREEFQQLERMVCFEKHGDDDKRLPYARCWAQSILMNGLSTVLPVLNATHLNGLALLLLLLLFSMFACVLCSYIRENPETLLPRVVGCYRLKHTDLRLNEYFLVYLNPHPPPNAIKVKSTLETILRVWLVVGMHTGAKQRIFVCLLVVFSHCWFPLFSFCLFLQGHVQPRWAVHWTVVATVADRVSVGVPALRRHLFPRPARGDPEPEVPGT